MKGYVYNNTCYIFPNQEAAAIPEQQDVTEYLIQYDELDAYKEINTTLADKLFGYNYNTMTVNPKPWKDHQDDDLHRPGPDHLTFIWADGCDELIREEDRINSVENPSSIRLFGAQGVSFMETDAWGRVYRYDLTYDGGDAWFNNPATQEEPSDLFISTHVEDPTVQSVTISITARNYTARHEWQDENEDSYEDLKYVFADNDDFTSEVVGSMYYAEEYYAEYGNTMYTLTIDGVEEAFVTQNSTNEGVVTVRVYNPGTDETYFTQSSDENDLANWTIQVGEGVTGEFIFTQNVPPVNSASFDDQTNEVTITLVDDNPFYSDALTTLFTSTPNFTITKDGVQLVDPTQNPEYDTQDPENPVLLDVEYGDTDGSFAIYYDGAEQQYQCTDISGESYAGVYVFTPVQL